MHSKYIIVFLFLKYAAENETIKIWMQPFESIKKSKMIDIIDKNILKELLLITNKFSKTRITKVIARIPLSNEKPRILSSKLSLKL